MGLEFRAFGIRLFREGWGSQEALDLRKSRVWTWALGFTVLELVFMVGVLGSLEARVLRNREVVV